MVGRDSRRRLLLIDLSGDFRVGQPQFVYGLPEWNKAAISGARRIASPGCLRPRCSLDCCRLEG